MDLSPDSIPDTLAFRHYFMAIAAHPAPSTEEGARQAAQLFPLGLSTVDRENLIKVLAAFRTKLDGIESARSQVLAGGSPAPAKLVMARLA